MNRWSTQPPCRIENALFADCNRLGQCAAEADRLRTDRDRIDNPPIIACRLYGRQPAAQIEPFNIINL